MSARREVAQRMRSLLEDGCVILDLETTGLADSRVDIVEVAIIDAQGTPLLNTLVKPRGPIPLEASRVNGIYDHDVADAPSFLEIYPRLLRHLAGQPVVAYNYTFERDILDICVGRYGLRLAIKEWACAMRDYTKFTGTARYCKLTNACVQEGIVVGEAHRALGDTLMTLELMRRMAAG